MAKILGPLAPYAKTIAAILAPVIVAFVARYGFDVDVNWATTEIIAVLTGGSVFGTTNKPAA